MTNPVGYSDWQRSFASARHLLFLDLGMTIAAPRVSGAIPVANISDVGAFANSTSNHVQIVFDWFLDQALTALLSTDEIDIRQGTTFDQTIRVKGSFLRITINPFGGASSTYTLNVYEATGPAIAMRGYGDNALLTANGTSVPPGASTVTAPRIIAGMATFQAYSTDATSYNVELRATSASGASTVYARNDTNNRAPLNVMVPAAQMSFVANNFDAVNRFFFVFLTVKPFYPAA